MRTTSLTWMFLISAVIALALSPERPTLLVPWSAMPADDPAAAGPGAVPGELVRLEDAGTATGSHVAAGIAAEAVALLNLNVGVPGTAGLSVRLHAPPDQAASAEALPMATPLRLAEMRSMPSGMTGIVPPRRAAWPTPARPVVCPFASARACQAWQAGR